ncbi:MAG: hypothetical protein AAB738_02840 [Patescibacteria group bacterium]
MAIIVEEGKKSISFLNILTWLIVIGVIFFATYYIFFKKPEIVDVIIPSTDAFDNIEQLSKITLDPGIIQDPALQALSTYLPVPETGRAGRPNPFLPL